MKKWVQNLFSEGSTVSAVRVMAISCVVVASFVAVYSVIKGQALEPASILCGTFLGAAFGGKVVQKRYEKGAAK